MFNRVIIIGLGLIGGSIARDVKNKNLATKILATTNSQDNINFAKENNIIDDVYDFKSELKADDLVILATPLNAYAKIAKLVAPKMHEQTTIIDVGSVKSFVRTDIFLKFGALSKNFVPCHPIAGTEKSGVRNSLENLFVNKRLIITQNDNCDKNRIDKVKRFWQKIGSNVEFLNDDEHDKIFALTSHFPQLISYLIKKNTPDSSFINIKDEIIQKHLRLENSSPEIWNDIFNLNKTHLNHYINIYGQNIDKIISYLEGDKLEELNILCEEALINAKIDVSVKVVDVEMSKEILFRIFALLPYCLILDLKSFNKHFGSGFKDFTIILIYLRYMLQNQELMEKLIKENQQDIIRFLLELKKIKL